MISEVWKSWNWVQLRADVVNRFGFTRGQGIKLTVTIKIIGIVGTFAATIVHVNAHLQEAPYRCPRVRK